MANYSPDHFDVYLCPNAFSKPHRRSEFALDTRYAWCDIDDADPDGYDPRANILWETSPGRYQGLWIWRNSVPGRVAEEHSRNIVYKDGGDKGGWSVTKMLRVPGTVNHKPEYDLPRVKLRHCDLAPQKRPRSISRLTSMPSVSAGRADPIDLTGIDPQDVIRRYRRKVSFFARSLMTADRVIYPDRSAAIFVIVSDLVSAGANDLEIASVLLNNPHFVQKHGASLDMAEREIGAIRAKVEAGQ